MWLYLLNEILILQSLLFLNLFFFINALNILTLWYLAGLFLINLGLLLLNDDGDIFIGFLWVIDLGVGLIFFIFILHFLTFLYQKSSVHNNNRLLFFYYFFIIFLLFFYYFLAFTSEFYDDLQIKNLWFFSVSSYDYFNFLNFFSTTDLNLLREIYFYNNSFAFFVVNIMLFYGIFLTINLTFMLKRIFLFLNFGQIINTKLLLETNSYFFIRNQNFLKQQNTSAGARVWVKKKHFFNNDF